MALLLYLNQPPVGDEMVHSVAHAFLLFLESLAEPVIPRDLHAKCMEAHNNSILCRQVSGT